MARQPKCARCGGPLPPVGPQGGRPRRYCRAACRKAAYRARVSKARRGRQGPR